MIEKKKFVRLSDVTDWPVFFFFVNVNYYTVTLRCEIEYEGLLKHRGETRRTVLVYTVQKKSSNLFHTRL